MVMFIWISWDIMLIEWDFMGYNGDLPWMCDVFGLENVIVTLDLIGFHWTTLMGLKLRHHPDIRNLKVHMTWRQQAD